MNPTRSLRFAAIALATAGTIPVHAQELSGSWKLRLYSPDGTEVSSAVVRFLDTKGESCLAGSWKRVAISEVRTSDKRFFPLNESLSYELDGSQLTIGRNGLCDAYLHLNGRFKGTGVEGSYSSFGLEGSSPRGSFSLRPAG